MREPCGCLLRKGRGRGVAKKKHSTPPKPTSFFLYHPFCERLRFPSFLPPGAATRMERRRERKEGVHALARAQPLIASNVISPGSRRARTK